jgi:G8 domain
MTFIFRWTMKIQAIAAVLVSGVALLWHTHLCHAAFHSDDGNAMISNETFPVFDGTIKRSHLRVSDYHRREQVLGEVNGIRNFKPLLCNSEIFKTGYVCSRTWSSMFGTSETHTSRITIPCGVCLVMNHASGKLNLNGGIDIQGKLIVPDNVPIDITTTSIIVQGELSMTSTKPVNGIPQIKVTLVGSNDVTYTPIDVNAKACQGLTTCTAGKKPFVVAGGKVTCMYSCIGKIV